jgi:hypothetical protein
VNLEYYTFSTDTFYVYTATQNGTYKFQLFSVYEDCVSDSSVKGTIAVVCVGVEADYQNDGVLIYPIPAREELNIQADEEITYISLINQMGAEICQWINLGRKNLKINTKNLRPGFYYLKIETIRKKHSKKFLVVR